MKLQAPGFSLAQPALSFCRVNQRTEDGEHMCVTGQMGISHVVELPAVSSHRSWLCLPCGSPGTGSDSTEQSGSSSLGSIRTDQQAWTVLLQSKSLAEPSEAPGESETAMELNNTPTPPNTPLPFVQVCQGVCQS